jgi:hypothetical protein
MGHIRSSVIIGPSAARPVTNHDKSGIRVVQVEKCELPKDFRGPPIGDRVLVRDFTEEGWSGARCGLLNFVVNCFDHLGKVVWSDKCMR